MRRRRCSRLLVALLVVGPLTGCTGSEGGAPPAATSVEALIRGELAEAQDRWSTADVSDYTLSISERENTWTRGCRWTTVFEDGEVIEASVGTDPENTDSPYCTTVEWSVERLHATVGRWADEVEEFADPVFGEHVLAVSFDQQGVPSSLVFDLANGDDEESSLVVTFTPAGE